MEKAGITAKSAEIAKVAVRGQIHETVLAVAVVWSGRGAGLSKKIPCREQ